MLVEKEIIWPSESNGSNTSLNGLNKLLNKLVFKVAISEDMQPGRIRN